MPCTHWAECHLPRCNKPSWNGQPGEFCCTRCRSEAAQPSIIPARFEEPPSNVPARFEEPPSARPNHHKLGIRVVDAEWFVKDRVEFPQKYQRNEGRDGWITQLHGKRLTGFDLKIAIRDYMESKGSAHLSVCELALSEGNWASKSFESGPAVGEATIIGSHVQLESWDDTVAALKDGLEYAASMRPWSTYVFLDYFSVRPLEVRFDLQAARSRIEGVGRTLAIIPRHPLDYLANAHCLFECVATLKRSGTLDVHMPNEVYDKREVPYAYLTLKRQFDIGVNSRAARCTNERDNQILQGYFGGVGEDWADQAMKHALFTWLWENGQRQLLDDGIQREYWGI